MIHKDVIAGLIYRIFTILKMKFGNEIHAEVPL